MTVLVAYASAQGSTKGVAEEVARRLSAAGLSVDVRPADEVTHTAGYDAVVLGSAIHDRRWLRAAVNLLNELRKKPPRPVWLFSVCTVGETTSFLGPRATRWARRARKLPPGIAEAAAPHRFFAGVIERSHWNAWGRLFFAATGGRYGDRRDWADIDAWADGIVAALVGRGTVA